MLKKDLQNPFLILAHKYDTPTFGDSVKKALFLTFNIVRVGVLGNIILYKIVSLLTVLGYFPITFCAFLHKIIFPAVFIYSGCTILILLILYIKNPF